MCELSNRTTPVARALALAPAVGHGLLEESGDCEADADGRGVPDARADKVAEGVMDTVVLAETDFVDEALTRGEAL
jgi:hypothetical protein